MSYTPNTSDAIGAYMAAAAHYHSGSPMQPSHHQVEERNAGEFIIPDTDDRDQRGRFVGPIAVCTFIEDGDLWEVKLRDVDDVIVVRDVNGEFVAEDGD